MKLKRYTPDYLKYWHNKEEIDRLISILENNQDIYNIIL